MPLSNIHIMNEPPQILLSSGRLPQLVLLPIPPSQFLPKNDLEKGLSPQYAGTVVLARLLNGEEVLMVRERCAMHAASIMLKWLSVTDLWLLQKF